MRIAAAELCGSIPDQWRWRNVPMSKAAAMISCVEVDFVCIIAMACLAHKAVGVGFDRPIKNKLFERAL